MTANNEELLEELETNLNDLNGDILALVIFIRCQEKVSEDFGDSVSRRYLRRLRDYIEQHMQEMQKLICILTKNTSLELNLDAKTGRD